MAEALRVDLIELAVELPACGASGRIGMCRLPGFEPPELAADIAALERVGASTVVTLNRSDELYWLPGLVDDEGFLARMGRAGFRHRQFEIHNGGVPASRAEFAALIAEVCAELRAGKTVVIHCVAGHGRTGLMAACCLVALGATPGRAVDIVRRVRPGTIETDRQEAFVSEFAAP